MSEPFAGDTALARHGDAGGVFAVALGLAK